MSSWSAAADGNPDLSKDRYQRLVRLSNDIIKCKPRPHYVVFPELAIPRKWARTFAHHFLRNGISLIAGVEYGFDSESPPNLLNDARLYLTDNRLGFPSYVVLTQRKGHPAIHERSELRSRFGRSLAPVDDELCRKHTYKHFGFYFSVLVCSELTDIGHRSAMRGRIDNLFVLSWNQDLETFSSLVESSALDIHCYMTLVNNRMYGDSRVRSPHKKGWMRDIVRVKGGTDDYFVVAELDIPGLREFQSHVESPTEGFKPVPEGFVIAPYRRVIPGT